MKTPSADAELFLTRELLYKIQFIAIVVLNESGDNSSTREKKRIWEICCYF